MSNIAVFNTDVSTKVKGTLSEYHQTLFNGDRYFCSKDIWIASNIPTLMSKDIPAYLAATIWFPASSSGREILINAKNNCEIQYEAEDGNPWIVAGGVIILREVLTNPWDITEWVSHSQFWCLYHDLTKQVFIPHNWRWIDYSDKMDPQKLKWFTEIFKIWKRVHGQD